MRRLFAVILTIAIAISPAIAADTPVPAKVQRKAKPTQARPESITILSIIPAQGEPGTTVTLSGTGFSDVSSVFLGSVEIATKLISPKQLSFEIPRLASGLYALFVRTEDGSTSKTYSFSVLPQKPVALSLSPDRVPVCSQSGTLEVVINGKNFLEGAQVLFDGGAIGSRYLSAESMSFAVPAVKSGMHQVLVKNPEEMSSTPLALLVDSRPEIYSATQGNDFVNYYQMTIEGKNFSPGSAILVNGQRVSVGIPAPGDHDRLLYQDCSRLLYQRYPADPSPKTLRIQVINPGNEESPAITINAP